MKLAALIFLLMMPAMAQKQTTIQVQVNPEATITPTQVALNFHVDQPPSTKDILSIPIPVTVKARLSANQHIDYKISFSNTDLNVTWGLDESLTQSGTHNGLLIFSLMGPYTPGDYPTRATIAVQVNK